MRGASLSGAVAAVRARVGAWRRRRYLQSLSTAHYAPYPVRVYRDFLSRVLQDRELEVAPFVDANAGLGCATLFVRHDIDTAACARGMGVLLGIDRELGVRSGIYLLAGSTEYRLADHRDEIAAWRATGFEVGLHTVCYTHDDYFAALEAETRAFADALGFAPRSFTVHGLGEHRLDVRLRFYREVLPRLGEFGYEFTDCCPELRSYDRVFHDCHWDTAKQARYIYDELTGRRFPFERGKSYLLLTHPCYWLPQGRSA
jgi:hypothetical protein